MNSSQRLWLLAAVSSVVMVVIPLASCGTPKSKCNATTCFGCCDAMEQCQAGNSTTACGASAGMCTSCAFGSVCSFGMCNTGNTGGGGGGTGGGTGGGATGGGTGAGTTGGGTGGGVTGGGTGGGVTGGGIGGGTGGGVTGGGTGGGGGALIGDTCATGQTIAFVNNVATLTGTTSGYNHDFTSSCANAGQPDRVIVFNQPTTGEIAFSLVSSGFTPALSVHLFSSGVCGNEVGCFVATGVGATITHQQVVPAGTYAIIIDSATTGGGPFTLTATRIGGGMDAGPPVTLQNNVSRSISGLPQSLQYFQVLVPTGSSQLTFTTTGGTGDVDIYAEFGTQADPQSATYQSGSTGTAETITIPSPAPGLWYLTAFGYTDYMSVSLTASF